MGFSWIYGWKPWKIMDEIKWKVWYMVRKNTSFSWHSQTYLNMDYGNAWFVLLWQKIFYQVVIDCNSVNINTMSAFVHSRYSLIWLGVAREDMSPPNINLGSQAPHFKLVYWSCWTIKLLSHALDLNNIHFYNQGILGVMSNKHSLPFTWWFQVMLLSGEHQVRWPSGCARHTQWTYHCGKPIEL